MRWVFSPVDPEATEVLCRELKVSPLVARLLVRRGIREPAAAHRFLHPSVDHLHDPFLMADMSAAVERLRRAIDQKEKILIYGDYDVDGTMAAVVLLTALRALGGSVEAHVPHRLTEGYGMRTGVIERAAGDGVRVVLSVDTGSREHEVVAYARDRGIDCIVTDHHLPGSDLPAACAILNPRRADCAYPEKNLSGAGVAFKLAQALLGPRLKDRPLHSYLKIVALGTIADLVPLIGENRNIAHFGLAALRSLPSRRSGLRALLAASGLDGRAVTTADVAFRIAPRLNAAGRMDNAREVIELLTTADATIAHDIAERLEGLNRERQRVEEEILGQITSFMEQHPEKADRYFSGLCKRGLAPGSYRNCGAAGCRAVPPAHASHRSRGWDRPGIRPIDPGISHSGGAHRRPHFGGKRRALRALRRARPGGRVCSAGRAGGRTRSPV